MFLKLKDEHKKILNYCLFGLFGLVVVYYIYKKIIKGNEEYYQQPENCTKKCLNKRNPNPQSCMYDCTRKNSEIKYKMELDAYYKSIN